MVLGASAAGPSIARSLPEHRAADTSKNDYVPATRANRDWRAIRKTPSSCPLAIADNEKPTDGGLTRRSASQCRLGCRCGGRRYRGQTDSRLWAQRLTPRPSRAATRPANSSRVASSRSGTGLIPNIVVASAPQSRQRLARTWIADARYADARFCVAIFVERAHDWPSRRGFLWTVCQLAPMERGPSVFGQRG